MEYIYIGKIVNTHGIKGELRIQSSFDQKEKVFIPNFKLYIGDNHIEEIINTYRHHKEFEMVTFKNYSNINEVLKYLKQKVYINREDLNLKDNEYILDDLLNLKVIEDNKEIGIVEDIIENNTNILLSIKSTKNFYIPYNPNFIKGVDLKSGTITVENTKGLII